MPKQTNEENLRNVIRDLSVRISTLEVLVELSTAVEAAQYDDPNQRIEEHQKIAAIVLSRLPTKHQQDDLLSALQKRMNGVREHLQFAKRLK